MCCAGTYDARMGPGAFLPTPGRAQTFSSWVEATLQALDERLGYDRSSLLLVLASDGRSPNRAFAGAARGWTTDVLAEYYAHWADSDPLAGNLAHEMFDKCGYASTAQLYPNLDRPQRRFVDEFLAAIDVGDQLSFRLAGNDRSDGYLTVHASRPIGTTDQQVLLELVPPLAKRLRSFLPRGLAGALSSRERQAAELVAFGLTNREIARVMNIGEDTVKKHLYRGMRTLGIERRAQLAVSWTTGRRLDLAVS